MVPESLLSAYDQVRDEVRRTDAKATMLLSLVGAALAGTVALSNRPMSDVAAALLWSAMAPITTSVVVLLLVIRPRLSAAPVEGTWLHAAQIGPARLLELHRISTEDSGTRVAAHVCVLARIAKAKYSGIRAAVLLLALGLLPLLTSAVVSG